MVRTKKGEKTAKEQRTTRAAVGRTMVGQGRGGEAARGGTETTNVTRTGGPNFPYLSLLSNVIRDAEERVRHQQAMQKSLEAAVYWSGEVLLKAEEEWVNLRVRMGEENLENHAQRREWEQDKTWEYACFASGGRELSTAFKYSGKEIGVRSNVWKKWNVVVGKLNKLSDEQLAMAVESRKNLKDDD